MKTQNFVQANYVVNKKLAKKEVANILRSEKSM